MALVPDVVYEYTKTRKENGFPYSNQKIFLTRCGGGL
jgi:hypothetical protein